MEQKTDYIMNGKQLSAFILGFCLLAGCSRKSHRDEALTPIRLATSLHARSAIDTFDDLPVALVAGMQADSPDETWTGIADGGRITLTPARYYPQDGSTLYLRGFYPPAEAENNSVRYTLTGSEDLLYADVQAGSAARPFDSSGSILSFRHLLVQLHVTIKAGTGIPSGCRLKSVCINGSAAGAALDLLHGTLSFTGDPSALYLYHAENHEAARPLPPDENIPLGYMLVQPGAALTVNLVLSRSGREEDDLAIDGIPVEFEGGGSQTGLAYKVEINIPVPLSLDAVLTEWTDGSSGTGNVTVPPARQE